MYTIKASCSCGAELKLKLEVSDINMHEAVSRMSCVLVGAFNVREFASKVSDCVGELFSHGQYGKYVKQTIQGTKLVARVAIFKN